MAEGIYRVDPTPEDLATGCTPDDFVFMAPGTRCGWGNKEQREMEKWGPDPVFAYRLLWNHIHGDGAWDENPWVTATTFTAERRNIDARVAA